MFAGFIIEFIRDFMCSGCWRWVWLTLTWMCQNRICNASN